MAAAIVVFGVAVMVISVIQAIDKMINGKSPCCLANSSQAC